MRIHQAAAVKPRVPVLIARAVINWAEKLPNQEEEARKVKRILCALSR